jgi:transposase
VAKKVSGLNKYVVVELTTPQIKLGDHMNTYCGLDVSNKSTAICVIDEAGTILCELTVATEVGVIVKGLRGFGKVRCVIEASPLAESLATGVERAGHIVELLDTRQAKIITHSKKKTDKFDARKLAQLCRVGWYTTVHRKSGESRSLRTYLTARMEIVKSACALNACIRGLLRAHGIVLVKVREQSFDKAVKAALAGADQLVVKAIEPLLEHWAALHSEGERMYRELDRKIVRKDPRMKLLTTAPGIGPATAAAYVATIDDPQRFRSEDQVSSYLGLVPSVYQSGPVELKGRITKHGDFLLRWLLVESATTLLSRTKKDCPLKSWGLKLQETKGFGKARVAVARKLACLLLHMLKTGKAFDYKMAA